MSSSSPTDYGATSYHQQSEIDQICDEFEKQCKAGARPAADEFANSCDPHIRSALVTELFKLELDYRRDESDAVRAEYEQRFPDLADAIRRTRVGGERHLEPGDLWKGFRIEEQIGQGGMGVVYRANDTRLERSVALKFLPSRFALDQERLIRFEREAKILAGLNHPNIATLHNFEEHDGTCCLVLELVQGQTLGRQRLSRRDIASVFSQIAFALASAHEAGVVHRDLKPSNVMITEDGTAKVLDFGLARSSSVSRSLGELQKDGVSQAKPEPERGLHASGTLAYMSPEQMQGQKVDKRCDVWAFGCCLFEALTGKRAFPQDTIDDLFSAIAEQDPDWSRLPQDVPEPILRLVRRCLTKDCRRRLRDLGDARLELEDYHGELLAGPTKTQKELGVPAKMPVLAALLVGVMLGTIITFAGLGRGAGDGSSPQFRPSVFVPDGHQVAESPAIALSPDGNYLTYVAVDEQGVRRLFVRPMKDSHESSVLAGTEGASQPFFSPNGQTIGFFADHQLKKVSVFGGQPVTLCDVLHPSGGCWSPDGQRILYGFNWGQALDSIAYDGSDQRHLARIGTAFVFYWPQLLPDGNTILFGRGKVMLSDLRQLEASADDLVVTDRPRVLIPRGSFARFLNGQLLYGYRGTLYSAPLDLKSLQLGDSQIVADDLWTSASGSAQFAVSAEGHIAYVPGEAMEQGKLVWKSRAGGEAVPAWPDSGFQVYESFRLSPNAEKLAIGILGSEGYDLWIHDFATGRSSNLGLEGDNLRPLWSHDGKHLVFMWDQLRKPGILQERTQFENHPRLTPRKRIPANSRLVERRWGKADLLSHTARTGRRCPGIRYRGSDRTATIE